MKTKSAIFFYSLTLILCVISLRGIFAFTLISNSGKPAYWRNNIAPFKLHSTTSGYFTGGHDLSGTSSDEFTPIIAGFTSWTSIPGLNLTAQNQGTATGTQPASGDNQNSIGWVRTGWRSLSFRPPSNALAVTLLSFDTGTGQIAEADIYFNAESFRWAVVDNVSESGYIDVQNIATHEVGHFLGIDHSSEDLFETDGALADATMFYAASAGETSRRDPHLDDTLAISSLYSSSSLGTPRITSADLVSSSSGVIKFKVHGTGFNDYTSFVLSKESADEYDVVSRYRTILSSTEADIQFDTLGLSGAVSLIAFNSAKSLASFTINLTSLGLDSTSASSGGGGCELSANASPDLGMSAFILFIIFMTLFSLRFSVRAVKVKSCSTQRGKNKSSFRSNN